MSSSCKGGSASGFLQMSSLYAYHLCETVGLCYSNLADCHLGRGCPGTEGLRFVGSQLKPSSLVTADFHEPSAKDSCEAHIVTAATEVLSAPMGFRRNFSTRRQHLPIRHREIKSNYLPGPYPCVVVIATLCDSIPTSYESTEYLNS